MSKLIYLSHSLNESSPSYGNREKFILNRVRSIAKGDRANDCKFEMSAHLGTHIDMPFHFYQDGQTIQDFDANFWHFTSPVYIEINPNNMVVCDELIEKLDPIDIALTDCLLIKTGIGAHRGEQVFWEKNYGLATELAEYLRQKAPNLKVIGFDSISLSSFQHRDIGKAAHLAFLDPSHPILPIEDMDLTQLNENSTLERVVVAPLRVENADGLPVTVFGEISD